MSNNVYDLCIIGAGMFGSAAARHASMNPSLKVCLIGPVEPSEDETERRKTYGCHYDEGRIVSEIITDKYEYSILGKQSIKRYRELEQLSGISFYNPVGCLVVSENDSSYYRECLRSYSNKVVDISQKYLFKTRFPFLRLDVDDYPLLDNNGAGYISARNIVKAQIKVSRLQGCNVIEDTVVLVKPLTDETHEILTKNKGSIKAKRVLVCTGALTNFWKFAPFKRLKIELSMETFILVNVDKEEAERLKLMPTAHYVRRTKNIPPIMEGAYILPPIQYPDGQYYIKAGPLEDTPNPNMKTLNDVKEWYNSSGNLDMANGLFMLVRKLIPNFKTEKIKSKTCITCNTPSRLPYIDRISPTVTIAVAGNGYGATLSEEVGRIAAELSVTGKWNSELSKELFVANFEE